MTANELIKELQEIVKKHGDLPIVGGYLVDDGGINEALVVDKNSVQLALNSELEPAGVFLT